MDEVMARIYARLVIAGRQSIDEVPEKLRELTKKAMEQMSIF